MFEQNTNTDDYKQAWGKSKVKNSLHFRFLGGK